MSYDAIVFDLFGVVCSEIAPYWLADYLSSAEALRVKKEVIGAADTGEISQPALFERLSRLTGVPADQVEAQWWAYVQIDTKVVALIRTLRARFKIGLLTNSPSPFCRRILAEHELAGLFDAVVVSSEHRVAKPDRKIYEVVLSELGVQPAEALMIDDNPANVGGAIAAGMRGLLFHSYEELQRAVASR